jgi:DGQHR domain-containing protein
MKLEAFHLKQNNHDLFVTHLPARQLLANAAIPRYDPHTKEGYQRLPRLARIKGVANFLRSSPVAIFPTAVLLNSRSPIQVVHGRGYGMVKITVSGKLQVVDGQTRMLGLQFLMDAGEEYGNFPLPVVICNLKDEIEELVNFRVINREAKSVPTGLTDRLIAKQLHRALEEGAEIEHLKTLFDQKFYSVFQLVRVAQSLGERPASPWRGKIKVPNVEGQIGASVSERSFTSSLRPALGAMGDLHDSRMADRLTAFWQAVYQTCKQAEEDPKGFPYLRKPVAAYIGHRIYSKIYPDMSSYNKSNFVKKLREIPGLRSNLWVKDGGLKGVAGLSNYDLIANQLLASKRV